jgi:transcriptional regulator with XRE-family HTH domain
MFTQGLYSVWRYRFFYHLSVNGYMKIPRSNRIAELRKAAGLSQAQLADAVGAHWVTISKLERGQQKLTFEWMEKLAPVLNVPVYRLMGQDLPSTPIRVFGEINGDGFRSFGADGIVEVQLHADVTRSPINDWYIVRGDDFWPFFHDGDYIALTSTDRPSEEFIGRFCTFLTEEDLEFFGVLAPGKDQGRFNIAIPGKTGHFNLKGRVWRYLGCAVYDPQRWESEIHSHDSLDRLLKKYQELGLTPPKEL